MARLSTRRAWWRAVTRASRLSFDATSGLESAERSHRSAADAPKDCRGRPPVASLMSAGLALAIATIPAAGWAKEAETPPQPAPASSSSPPPLAATAIASAHRHPKRGPHAQTIVLTPRPRPAKPRSEPRKVPLEHLPSAMPPPGDPHPN